MNKNDCDEVAKAIFSNFDSIAIAESELSGLHNDLELIDSRLLERYEHYKGVEEKKQRIEEAYVKAMENAYGESWLIRHDIPERDANKIYSDVLSGTD